MTALVLRGDARQLPLPDGSADLICTSPPYYSLRDYRDGEESLAGQIGSESTPQEYLEMLWEATAEWARVLKDDGSMFVLLGDKYGRPGGIDRKERGAAFSDPAGRAAPRLSQRSHGLDKSLMLLPERYRIGCVDRLGLIARAVITWSKANGLPESVTDRVRRSHEDLIHLTKQPRYYAAVDEIRSPASGYSRPSNAARATPNGVRTRGMADTVNPLGALPGSVWHILTEPLRVPAYLPQHFAAMPSEIVRRVVLGWSPPGICVECGQGRRPVVNRTPMQWRPSPTLSGRNAPGIARQTASGTMLAASETRILGYACPCCPYTDHPGTGESKRGARGWGAGSTPDRPRQNSSGPWREWHIDRWTPPPTRRAVIVDPFSGTGTVPLVASVLGRVGVGVDLSAGYCRTGRWRTQDPGQRARAARVGKPPIEVDGQGSLLDLIEEVTG